MNKRQVLAGVFLLVITLVVGFIGLESDALIFRLLIGLVLGYALARGSYGFAGAVNRAYKCGSTKLMRALMFMFVISALSTAVLLYSGTITAEMLKIKQINLGLFVGGIIFGIGMALAGCCASGVLTTFRENTLKAFVVLIFFSIGVFFGLPVQRSGDFDWVSKSWFSSADHKGVFLPDWFNGPFDGLIGALLITLVLALIVTYASLVYEKAMREKGKCQLVKSEEAIKEIAHKELPVNPLSKGTYDYILGNPWSLKTSAVVITGAFTALMVVTKGGWGISKIFGLWFAKLLTVIGVSETWVSDFIHMDIAKFEVLSNAVSVQNIAIILGAFIAVLTMGKFKFAFRISLKELIIYIIGGFLLGFGTRLSNGCNVGALYTPIASFSLSGWFYLVAMVTGGILGNRVLKQFGK